MEVLIFNFYHIAIYDIVICKEAPSSKQYVNRINACFGMFFVGLYLFLHLH